ncbi:MAG: PIN domain-containing protein [Chloroflexi bacterium]|nr:PIN domain-containing protein [Chloroflexota bacterium]
MVAALSEWHEHYPLAIREIRGRLDRGDEMVVAAHSLAEAYAVLTRLPPPYRLSPAQAFALLEADFVSGREIIGLGGKQYTDLLRDAAASGIRGGATYDAVVAACALAARADALLTFNERHFLPFAGQGMEIVVPG